MGRHCGWLTGATAEAYRKRLDKWEFLPGMRLARECWDVHAVWVPEIDLDLDSEIERLNGVMDKHDCVNLFLSEGAGMEAIIRERKPPGKKFDATHSVTPVWMSLILESGLPQSSGRGLEPTRSWFRKVGTLEGLRLPTSAISS